MSTSSIPPSLTEVSRVPSSTDRSKATTTLAAAKARPASARATPAAPAAGEDTAKTPASTPPRFPWLSRLSQQLEPTAKQKPPFPSAPVLGDNIDKSA